MLYYDKYQEINCYGSPEAVVINFRQMVKWGKDSQGQLCLDMDSKDKDFTMERKKNE